MSEIELLKEEIKNLRKSIKDIHHYFEICNRDSWNLYGRFLYVKTNLLGMFEGNTNEKVANGYVKEYYELIDQIKKNNIKTNST
ncbi:MAG TPA: hypothetical protein VN703_06620 [Candidatus Sulfopaludibacter sp.]|nr:hypothetical protein [Candidatus Sulfopaludibacter sp.]